MKLSSKVLAGSLASAGMVLSLVAPALTAQAATTTGQIDDKGNVTHVTKTDIGSLTNPDNGQLAIAYDSAAGGDGEATATSNAAVKVVNGVLVLNEVPDFNFGSAVEGQTKNLVDNSRVDADAQGHDGNSDGNLSVLESRDLTKATGFKLQAQLGDFVDASTGKKQALSAGNAFILNLLPQSVTDGQNVITGLTTDNVSLNSNDSAASTVMNVSKDKLGTNYKDGEYLTTYNAADNATGKKAGATLTIPSDISASSTGKVSSLNAPVTWTLTTTPETTTTTPTEP